MFCILTLVLIVLQGYCHCQCTDRNTCTRYDENILPGCYCDDECLRYKDCCSEYFSSRLGTNGISLRFESDNHDTLSLDETCISLTDSSLFIANRIGAFMIDRCLATGRKCLVEDRRMETILPVSGGNKTYRNGQCAICNGVSDFTLWTIVYRVPNENEVLSVTPSGESINDDNVFQLLQHGNISQQEYILHPPTGHVPRYCPYDIVSSIDENETIDAMATISLHQNVVGCKGALYKNIEICNKIGCCQSSMIHCVSFIFPFSMKISGHPRKDKVIDGLRILIKFTKEDIIESDKVLTVAPQITYTNHQVPMIIQIKEMSKESFNLNECVHGLIVTLQYSRFKLIPVHIKYKHATDGKNTHIVFIPFREGAKLAESEFNELNHLKQSLTFEKATRGVMATGELKVIAMSTSLASIFWKSASITQTYMQPLTTKTHPPCSNVTVIISGRVADSKCMDKDLINGANNNKETLTVLMILILPLFQYQINMY